MPKSFAALLNCCRVFRLALPTQALRRQAGGSARIIPVLLRSVSWEGTELADLQPLPEEAIPITAWSDRDQAWTMVISGLRRALLAAA